MKNRATKWILVVVALAALVATQFQIRELDTVAREATSRSRGLEDEVIRLETELRAERQETKAVETRVASLASDVDCRQAELETRTRETLTATTVQIHASLEKEFGLLRTSLSSATARLDALKPDQDVLCRDLIWPTVQITCAGDIGSGVVIHSRADRSGVWNTYVLTAHHVVEDMIRVVNGQELRDPVQVRIFNPAAARYDPYEADIVSHHVPMDLALLRVRSNVGFPDTARLASRERLQALRSFTPIYTIGCPLGHEPMPSRGDITSLNKMVDGKKFWLVSAPTIFGNSGGGVFLEDTHELIGVCSMVCVYQNLIPVPVSHMGVVIPGEAVLAWLDSQYLQFVYREDVPKEVCDWMRSAMRPLDHSVLAVTWDH